MKTDQQDNSRPNERRRWLEAIAAGLAGVSVWKLVNREKSAPPSKHAAETPTIADAPMQNDRPSRTGRTSRIAVRPAAGAVKRHG
jgi:hypothetical protein